MNRSHRAAVLNRVDRPFVAEPLESRVLFAAGVLDTSFSGDGKVMTTGEPVGAPQQYYYGLQTTGATGTVVQPDGKLLMISSASFSDEGYYSYQTFVVRLNADGTRDTTFGDGGFAGVGGSNESVNTPDIALDASGRIYAVTNTDFTAPSIVRLRPDGQPDDTFGSSGYASLGFALDSVSGVSVQSDGKAVVTGRRYTPSGDSVIAVARLNNAGGPDASFGGGDGLVTKDFGYDWQVGADVAVRTDGRLVVAASVAADPGYFDRMALWVLDGAAGASLKSVVVDVPGGSERAAGVVLGPGNVAYLFGYHSANGGRLVVVKFDANGNLATAFGGGDGIATSAFKAYGYGETKSVAVAPDGKLLLTSSDDTIKRIQVARLTTAGAPDTSFDGDGLRTIDLASQYATADAVARLADGDVLVTGTRGSTTGGDAGILLIRLNSNGSADTSFAPGGAMVVDFDSDNAAADVAVMSDGRIVSAGYQIGADGKGDVVVTRHLANGSLDGNFDVPENYWNWLGHNDGRVVLDLGGDDRATAVDLLSDGRIIVAGYSTLPGEKSRFFVARLLADGQRDTSFGTNGLRRVHFGTAFNARAWDVKLQPDGKIVVAGGAGNATSNTAGDFAIARLTAGGNLDTSFSGDGIQRVSFGANLSTVARGLEIAPGGKIVLAGWAGGNAAVARLLANGNPDTAFSGDGKLLTDWGTSTDQYYGVDVDSAGKIIVGGSAGSNMVAARYTAAGVLDTTFDGDGKRTGPAGRANAVLVQATGKVILAGTNSVSSPSAFRLVRFTAGGAYDTLFSGDGQLDTTFTGKGPQAAGGLAFAPNDKIVAAGFATGADGDQDVALARYSFV